ncbi:hypothetical protein QUC31_015973 [Theobroma cacao]|uniref:Glycosyltransferase family 92 protein n=1 Tax=Theobroma cacao TaxID=3641 RepID=A0A061DXK9_THECC|nr:Domain of Uncharacterized protein function (DUF23) isoform 1 [Theobroma cacao]WRX13249.1 Glycosyltransferase family 92 - like 1 [Theobroma cacao]
MGKERSGGASGEKNNKMLVGVVCNFAAELKLLLTALLILCTLATLLQFIPSRFSISASDLRFCISRIAAADPPANSTTTLAQPSLFPNYTKTQVERNPQTDEVLPTGIIRRAFNPYGAAAYNFINMGSYRGGPDTFAIVGLASKPLHLYARPTYQCQWLPFDDRRSKENNTNITSSLTYKILPDWGYGRVYTVVVVNCTFPQPTNLDNSGGTLVLQASTSGGGDSKFNLTDTIPALTEPPGTLNLSLFTSRPKYDYLYCGSSLYGKLSPQRVREWIAYHVRLFGERSHFVIHDAGGVHEEVLEVLRPWMELGYVTLQDIREQERFDGYYHNQFMVVNDCLHRYKFMAKWIFFFDVDEFIYVPPKSTIRSVLDSLSDYSQFTIEQMPMSSKLCHTVDAAKRNRKWGFEKLVYRDVKKGIRRDRKYAIQPRNVFATGVHMSQNLAGKTTHKTEGRIKYFHYHGTIAERREPCRYLINSTEINYEKTPYVLDTTLRDVAGAVKKFELKMIGPRLQNTRQ